jgi:uncharacterized OB-fold protein
MSGKTVPQPTPETQFFWDKAALHELWLPKCADTGRVFFPPRFASPFTGGAVEWQRASGRGKLASYLLVHRPAPGFEGEVPYIVALIELEEGPRLMANLPGTPPDPAALKIGSPAVVTFETRGHQTLPQFSLVSE